MNTGAIVLVVLVPVIVIDGALWLYHAKSVVGFCIAMGAIYACVWLYRWATWR